MYRLEYFINVSLSRLIWVCTLVAFSHVPLSVEPVLFSSTVNGSSCDPVDIDRKDIPVLAISSLWGRAAVVLVESHNS